MGVGMRVWGKRVGVSDLGCKVSGHCHAARVQFKYLYMPPRSKRRNVLNKYGDTFGSNEFRS